MAHATRSHSAKFQAGGKGGFSRNVRADFSRGFLRSRVRMPLRRAAASRMLFSLPSKNILSPLLARSSDQSRVEIRATHWLRAGFASSDLRVAAIRALA